MFCARFFCTRMYAARFWPKVGVTIVFDPQWAMNSNQLVGPAVPQPVTR